MDQIRRRPTAAQAFEDAFNSTRDPRSVEYKSGCLAALRFRIDGTSMSPCPYPIGTAQSDAWFAGTEEGHRRWRMMEED